MPCCLPGSPADLKPIKYGKYSYYHKSKGDEVIVEPQLFGKDYAAIESANLLDKFLHSGRDSYLALTTQTDSRYNAAVTAMNIGC